MGSSKLDTSRVRMNEQGTLIVYIIDVTVLFGHARARLRMRMRKTSHLPPLLCFRRCHAHAVLPTRHLSPRHMVMTRRIPVKRYSSRLRHLFILQWMIFSLCNPSSASIFESLAFVRRVSHSVLFKLKQQSRQPIEKEERFVISREDSYMNLFIQWTFSRLFRAHVFKHCKPMFLFQDLDLRKNIRYFVRDIFLQNLSIQI